jgi:precorrin-2 dehydrogenase/sirohydrochlorin ferrochelatase
MLPISVDLSRIRVILVGDGEAARRRLALLDEAGAADLEVYAPHPVPALAAAAGARVGSRLPEPAEILRARLVFLARVDEPGAGRIRHIAEAAGILLNSEDEPACSDFHSAAVLRRGDFTIAVSTNGRSPGLAAAVRRDLERLFGPEWQAHLDRAAFMRDAWREAAARRDPQT